MNYFKQALRTCVGITSVTLFSGLIIIIYFCYMIHANSHLINQCNDIISKKNQLQQILATSAPQKAPLPTTDYLNKFEQYAKQNNVIIKSLSTRHNQHEKAETFDASLVGSYESLKKTIDMFLHENQNIRLTSLHWQEGADAAHRSLTLQFVVATA